jgi:dTDP-4-amino-4,6-dideoxygalactose transaminase
VLVTHLFGEPVDTAGIRAVLAHRGIALIEDCSHAHASRVGRERAGATADVAIFSLGARKIISGGHGGMLLTRDPLVYETALLVGHMKPRTRREFAGRPEAPFSELGLGGNLRMSPLAALLALDHLARLDELGTARVRNAAILDAALAPFATALHSTAPGENRTHFDLVWTVGTSRERNELVEVLVRLGVPARTVATRPLSRALAALPQPGAVRGRLWRALARWGEGGASLPVAEDLHDRALSLPSELFHAADATYATQLASVISGVLTGGAGE